MATVDLLYSPILDEGEENKPMPKRLHSIVQQRILFLLTQELGLDVTLPELAVAVLDEQGRNLVPDVVVLGVQARFENGVLTGGADLAVEIMSPKQPFSQLIEKCERLLLSGLVPTCWIIWPEHEAIYTYDLRSGLRQEFSAVVFESTRAARQIHLSLSIAVGCLPVES